MKADLISKLKLKILKNEHTPDNLVPENYSHLDWLDNVPVKIIVADAEGKAEYWNKQ